jgi:hypothetical protein
MFRANHARGAYPTTASRANHLTIKHRSPQAHVLKRNEFRHARLFRWP